MNVVEYRRLFGIVFIKMFHLSPLKKNNRQLEDSLLSNLIFFIDLLPIIFLIFNYDTTTICTDFTGIHL